MRLIKLTTLTGRAVWMNPDYVLNVTTAPDKGDLACAVTTTEVYRSEMAPHECLNVMYHIQGTPEEVAAKLMGEELQEPETWVPEHGESYWTADHQGAYICTWYGRDVDSRRLMENRVFPYTEAGKVLAYERAVEMMEANNV